MNKDQSKGKAENLKGRVKQAVGALTGNKGMQVEGAIDEAKGALRKKVGDVKQAIARTVDESDDK